MRQFVAVLLPVLLLLFGDFEVVFSGLVLNETFQNLDDWVIHIDGVTGVVEVVNGTSNGFMIPNVTDIEHPHTLFTNITHCRGGGCYRAEAALLPSLRTSVFPNCSVEYWYGTSIYVPTSWSYDAIGPSSSSDVTYHAQIHGGDNAGNSPIFSIRFQQDNVVIQICGNSGYNLSDICNNYQIGGIAKGEWMDFVVNSQLAYGQPTGWVKVWRNNDLMLNLNNLLTAYDEVNPPYPIVGSYQYNWKTNQTTGYNWAAVFHKELRVGNAGSNYDEVYTGNGAPCGSYCSSSSSNNDNGWSTEFLWFIIPISLVSIFSIVLFFGSSKYREKKWTESSRYSFRMSNTIGSGGPALEDQSYNYSFGRFLNGFDPNSDVKPKNQEWAELISPFRRASTTRTVFWYGFAVLWSFLAFLLALILYGGPGVFVHYQYTSGFIPWKHIDQWDAAQFTMIVISGTMTIIYFFPLIYLPHDFEAGRKWKNNPRFLQKIGVIIPCHKSANEIGEVLRRVLNYIPPENIVVCDNGNFDWPPDHTFEVVKKTDPKIRYVYIKQGHKTRALWTGVHRLPSHVEYVIHLDDDTHFDEHHMVFDESHFLNEKHVIAVAFLRSSYPSNTVTQFTDFWYKITDHFHATQAKICTRCFVPGPAGMWKRDKFMEIFGEHPSLPFGEDIFGGFTTLNNGYAIRAETRCMVKTFAPDILVPWFINLNTARVQGYGASSLWKQRAHRWTVSALRITGKSLYSFFSYDSKLGIASNIAFRLYRFREYKLILVQLLYIPFCLVILARGFYIEFLLLKFLLFVLPFTRNVYINYLCWRGQPELQVPLKTVLLSPFFNFFLICCAIHGRWKCILWYLPNVAPNHGMLQKCRPKALKSVPVEVNDLYMTDILTRTISTTSTSTTASSAQVSRDGEATFATNPLPTVSLGIAATMAAASAPPIVEKELDSWEGNSGNSSEVRADRVLKHSPNAFELFERIDGTSKIVFYTPKSKKIDEDEDEEQHKGGDKPGYQNPMHIPAVKAIPIDEAHPSQKSGRLSMHLETENKEYIDV